MFPITGAFQGDAWASLIAVDTEDTIETVGEKIAAVSVGKRLVSRAGGPGYEVLLNGEVLDPQTTFGNLGVLPMQWFEARFRD
jgi:Toluene-4-monooxygenase system protein B (TmoB)